MAWATKKKTRKFHRPKAKSRPAARRVKRAVRRFAKRRGWRKESRAHAIASKIGWTYKKYASDFRRFGAYAAKATVRGKHKGLRITGSSLRRYRAGRKTSLRRLEGRRERMKHRSASKRSYMGAFSKAKRRFGMAYNKTAYQRFIGSHVRGARGRAEVRRRFRAAVKAWKRRHHDNPVLPGVSYNKKRRKGRKSRRNPVLPMSYDNRRKHKKSRRKHRKNPLFRTRSGKFARRGHRRLHRIGGGGWHANRRRYRHNGAILPYTAYSNPVAAITGTFKEVTSVDLWGKTVVPLTIGFIGTHAVSLAAVKLIAPAGTAFTGIVKHGSRVVSSIVLSAVSGMILRDTDFAAKVLAGGLVAVLGGVISDIIGPDFTKMTGLGEMNDLADDLTEELKAKIAAGVRQQFSDADNDGSVSAFVTAEDLQRAPHLGDFVTSEALQRATVGSGMAARAGGGPPRAGEQSSPLAGLETFQDALADGSLI